MTAPPNVLWIFSDELRVDALSCYGNPWAAVATPHIDRIAARGTRFERFYVDSPVCVSSRYSLLTGRTPGRTGVYHNDAMTLGAAITPAPPFTSAFSAVGYRVADFGKGHAPLGLDAFGEAEAAGANQLELMEVAGTIDDRVVAPYGGTLAAAWPAGRPYPPEDVTANVTRFLAEMGDGSTPFFCRASFLQPHTPVIVPEPWASRYDSEPWPETVVPDSGLSRFEARYGEQGGVQSMSPEQVRAVRSRYYGLVSWLDDQVGRILDALDASGRGSDTIVVFGADHGALLGELGGGIGKQVFAPPSQQVPFLVAWPGTIDTDAVDGTIAAGVDFAPTMLGLAGLEPVGQLDGRDLFADEPPEAIYGMIGYGNVDARALSLVGWGSYVDDRGWPQRACVRTERYRLDRNTRIDDAPATPDDHDVFLADRDTDPEERQNLADDPSHASTRGELEALLDAHLAGARVIDHGQITEARRELRRMADELRAAEGMEGAG